MAMKHKYSKIGLAVCQVDLDGRVPSEIQLTPAGRFRARDGRPHEVPEGWFIDARLATSLIARAAMAQDALVIDYEHQTIHARDNGKAAPAAGWFRGVNLEWREGKGLFATQVDWTEPAKAAIAAREYRYISPVIAYDPNTGGVLAVLMAALTNFAALDGMADLAAVAAARFNLDHPDTEEDLVKREDLIKLLGLALTATDDDITTHITALKAQGDELADLRKALGVEAEGDAVAAVAALKSAGTEPDLSKYVPVNVVEELRGQIAALSTKLTDTEVDDLVTEALDDGKLLPAQEAWARELGKKDVAALKSYLETAQPIAALKGRQSNGQPPVDGNGTGIDDAALAVCRQMGVDPDDFKKHAAQ